MSFSVVKHPSTLVRPADPTPTGTLPLSSVDRVPFMRFAVIDAILVFRPGPDEPGKAIKEALSQALVPYYPVAGRIVDNSGTGQAEISCSGEGVWFVEASAACSLEDVKYFDGLPLPGQKEQLLPCPPPDVAVSEICFWMQVTQFKCGGFTVGIRLNHAVFDGMGVGQFMKAISEIAEGRSEPTVKPIWHRDAIPSPVIPTGASPSHSTAAPKTLSMELSVIDITHDVIDDLKNDYLKSTGRECTTFEILAAKLWQCRTRAIDLQPDAEVTFSLAADIRKLQVVLPPEGGYYGNCIYHLLINAPAGKIANAPIPEIVSLIRNSKENLRTSYTQWLKGDAEENPLKITLGYEAMHMLDWRRTGLFEVEFGSGNPVHVMPVVGGEFVAGGFILRSPAPMQGVRFVVKCVTKEHLENFYNEMKGWSCIC